MKARLDPTQYELVLSGTVRLAVIFMAIVGVVALLAVVHGTRRDSQMMTESARCLTSGYQIVVIDQETCVRGSACVTQTGR